MPERPPTPARAALDRVLRRAPGSGLWQAGPMYRPIPGRPAPVGAAPGRWLAAALVAGAACGPDAPGLGPIRPGTPRFAIVRTDYESTAVATLDAEGRVLAPALLSSGSRPPGLTAPLSGDVVLGEPAPSAGGEAGPWLTVVDRLGTDVVTVLHGETGRVRGQVRVSAGAPANPQDVAWIDASRGWVSRLEVNRDPSAPPLARGNDLVELDLAAGALTGRRIDLAGLDAEIALEGGGRAVIHARPSGLVRRGDVLVVGLVGLSAGFDAAGPGAIALVDLDDGRVRAIPLPPPVSNCGAVAAVPGAPQLVLASCVGFSERIGGEQPEAAALFVLRVTGLEARVERIFRPTADGPVAVQQATPLDARTVVAVDWGVLDGAPDTAHLIHLDSGATSLLHTASDAFVLGRASFDPDSGLLLLPDRTGALRRWRRTEAGLEPLGPVGFEDGPLPPDGARLLDAPR